MKVNVLKAFKDKHTGKMYKVGDTLVITKERFAEIKKKGNLVEEVKEVAKAKKTAE